MWWLKIDKQCMLRKPWSDGEMISLSIEDYHWACDPGLCKTMLMLSIFVIDCYSIPCNEMTKNMRFLSLDSIGLNSERHLNLRLFVLNIWTNGRWMTWHRSTRTVIRRTWGAWRRWIPVPVGPSAWIYRHVQRAEQQLQASDSLCVVHILPSA